MEAHRPGRIDTSGQTILPPSHHGLKIQPQLLNHQELDALNKQLLRAGLAIEATRKVLYETRYITYNALQELEIRQKCSNAYKEAHVQYSQKVEEAHELTTKCLSLHRELAESQENISNYELASKESERGVAVEKEGLEDRIEDLERMRSETEKGNMAQEHWAKISKRVAREGLAEQKIVELQKAMDKLIQRHQAVMTITMDRLNSAEQNLDVFRKKYGASEPPQMASIGSTPSPEQFPPLRAVPQGKTGTKRGTNPARRCASKYQKRDDATEAKEMCS